MLTPWGEALDKNAVLQEYPRPQLVRESYYNLNGLWDYAITASDACPGAWDGEILVPFSPDAPLSLLSLTGYSGGGKRMIADYEAPDRPANLHAPRPYAVGQSHKHLPEIMHVCGLTRPPVFQPVVMDVFSGMLVSLPLTEGILSRKASLAEVSDTYRAFFKGAALVRVLEDNPEAVIDSVALSGSDRMELFVTGNDDRMIAYARFDNLGKGACGAAIECLNLVLGAPPLTGLAL